MIEIWKDIPDYEGLYQVSNLGNVKSLPKKYNKNGCILKPKTKSDIYYKAVDLNKNGRKTFLIHHLVAKAFLNHDVKENKLLVIDHINNIKTDNCLENLQIVTHRVNVNKDMKSSSKYWGVSYYKKTNKWRCQKQIDGKLKHLGYFTTEEEARDAYNKN